MIQELSVVAAFVFGLSSAPHCIGMCGGIAGAMNAAPDRRLYPRAVLWRYSFLQNAGRILSYVLLGAVCASFGAGVSGFEYVTAARILAGVVFIALGVHFAFDWQGIRRVERIGQPLWKLVAPLAKKLLPAGTAPASFFLGTLWGLLPCGLVYTMLLAAAACANAGQGAAIMLAFGAGTLPAMFAFSWVSLRGRDRLRAVRWRRVIGAGAVLLGLWIIIESVGVADHGVHVHDHVHPH
jgi:uncharacterized protein